MLLIMEETVSISSRKKINFRNKFLVTLIIPLSNLIMFKKLILILGILLAYPICGYAQDVRYYKTVADSTSNPLVKLTALDSIISKSIQNRNYKTFIEHSLLYIDLAKDLDSIDLAAKKAMNLQSILTNIENDPEKAIAEINGVLLHKYKIKDSFFLGGLYLKRGGAHFGLDLKKAIEDYTLAIESFSAKDSLYVADAYLFRGQANSSLSNFVEAVDDFNTAYLYFDKLKEYDYMLFAQQGNINMFSMNGFYEKAKRERSLLIKKLHELNLNKYIPTEYYNQSLDYKKTSEDNLQIESLLKARKALNDSLNDVLTHLAIYSKLSEYYSTHNETKLASAYIDTVETFYKSIKNDLFAELNYNGAKSNYLISKEEYPEALLYANKKLENAKKIGYEDEILDSYLLLSEIYKKMGDFKNSLAYKEIYIHTKDSLYNRNNVNSLAYYQTQLETEKKEKELVEKNTNIQLLEKDSETYKKTMFLVSFAIALLFGVILLYRNRQNLKNNKFLQEKFSQKLLSSQEEERKRISKDLHDGIGQQLLLVKNKLIASGDTVTKQMIDNTIEEVRTISRDLHPFQLQELGITKAIEYSLNQIDENTTLFISSEIDNIDNIFTKEQEVNIYRIVQECLNNILKHAKAEASKVSVQKFTNYINISIKDNGTGFDFAEKYQDVKSLGLKTLLERTKFLNGQMKINSKIDSGTILEFKFPIK